MTDEDENEDWADELQKISRKIDDLARDLANDKHSLAIGTIKSKLEKCKNELGFVIENLK